MIAIEKLVRQALRGEGIKIGRRVLKKPGTIKVDGRRAPYSVGILCRIDHTGPSTFARMYAQLSPARSIVDVRVPLRYDRTMSGRDLALRVTISEYKHGRDDVERLSSLLRYIFHNAGMICDAHVENLPTKWEVNGGHTRQYPVSLGDGIAFCETYNIAGKNMFAKWGRMIGISDLRAEP